MNISTKAQLQVREAELIMLGKAFRVFAVAFARAAPYDVEPALTALMQSVANDLHDLGKKFPEGITTDHPLAMFARHVQNLVAEAREDIKKAAQPH